MNIENCIKCGKKFEWQLVGTVYPGGKDRESIRCPWCGEENGSRMTSQRMYIKKIDK